MWHKLAESLDRHRLQPKEKYLLNYGNVATTNTLYTLLPNYTLII